MSSSLLELAIDSISRLRLVVMSHNTGAISKRVFNEKKVLIKNA